MLVLLLIGVALGAMLLSYLKPSTLAINSDKATAAALAQAKDALIGFATGVNIIGAQRPGDLPCPDTWPAGSLNVGTATTPCNTLASRIGRLPWKTLGLPDLRDGAGERLWYAVSTNFKNNTRTGVLNSDTPGDFTVNTGAGTINNVIAIVFSPGPALGAQVRDGANQDNIANYLEGENANSDAIFATALATETFNDKLLLIAPDNFFPAVEYRVAREIRANLAAYFAANNYYPFASNYGDATFKCVPGLTRGRLPKPATPYDIATDCPGLLDWAGAAQPSSWFTTNNWHLLTFYTVAPACTNATLNCSGAGFLTVKGTAVPNDDKRAVVIIAGRALAGQNRPCAGVADCLDDPENTNLDDVYIKLPISSTFNDKVMIVAP